VDAPTYTNGDARANGYTFTNAFGDVDAGTDCYANTYRASTDANGDARAHTFAFGSGANAATDAHAEAHSHGRSHAHTDPIGDACTAIRGHRPASHVRHQGRPIDGHGARRRGTATA
jgi:hypothetical protein